MNQGQPAPPAQAPPAVPAAAVAPPALPAPHPPPLAVPAPPAPPTFALGPGCSHADRCNGDETVQQSHIAA